MEELHVKRSNAGALQDDEDETRAREAEVKGRPNVERKSSVGYVMAVYKVPLKRVFKFMFSWPRWLCR